MTRDTAPQSTFDGFTSPNYTQVPDELFDLLMPQLADNELRVLLYIVRRTFGFKRNADTISLSQMIHGITTKDGQVLDSGTGLSKSTVARGLKSLREKGIIVATRNASKERGDQPTTYRLRFKTDAEGAAVNAPVSHQQDTRRVSPTGQAVSHEWDIQETDEQETAFESSNGETREWDQMGEGREGDRTGSHPHLAGSSFSDGSLGEILKHRIRRDAGRNKREMIAVAIGRIAHELGDQADVKVSLSQALNLYQASGVGLDAYVDLLYRARGETKDRWQFPGKAPQPRNRMAYFFAVVEDRLGLRLASAGKGVG
jgi:DNA-binding transcriptional ArsR family regulator